jgi:ribosomal-protein-alanine N-acetyltransferase
VGVSELGAADVEDCFCLDQLALGGLWSQQQWLVELTEAQRLVVGVRAARGTLLAMASGWLILEELHITAVAVHPDHRRKGLARSVLTVLVQRAGQAGGQRATLEVSCGNVPAKNLYTSLGFRDVAIRRGYYRNGDDALIYYLAINGSLLVE